MRIAVVGTGIAGLGAAHALGRAGHALELFEAEPRAGGHTCTVAHDGLALDTGFLVHNVRAYPRLLELFAELGVRTQRSEMSFSVSCGCGVEWSSRRPWLAGRRLLREIVRFLRTAEPEGAGDQTLGEYAASRGFSESFRRHYLVPMTAAIWSAAPSLALAFPAAHALRFFQNHGMLGLRRDPWRTVAGGSDTYVRAILGRLGAPLHLDSPVRSLARTGDGVELRVGNGSRRFDAVVVATSAPRALALLEDPSADERRLLGAFAVTRNDSVLHTDDRLLPRRPGARAAWNFHLAGCGADPGVPTITYSLNRLQRLPAGKDYLVTLNRTEAIDPARVIRRVEVEHPQVSAASVAAQRELHTLNGPRATAFCGAWQGHGFHEDGLVSGLRAAAALGAAR